MRAFGKNTKISLRVTVFSIFLFIAIIIAGITLGLQYHFSREMADDAVEHSFRRVSRHVGDQIQLLDTKNVSLVRLLGHSRRFDSMPQGTSSNKTLELMSEALTFNKHLYAIYTGYDNGDYYELINLDSGVFVRQNFEAERHDRWIHIYITEAEGKRIQITQYLDHQHRVRREVKKEVEYDPRRRVWYRQAISQPGVIKTAPYYFKFLKASGVTYAQPLKNGNGVLAADMSLEGLAKFLKKQQLCCNGKAFLFDENGNIIVKANYENKHQHRNKKRTLSLSEKEKSFIKEHPVIRASNELDWPPFDFALGGTPQGYSIDLLNLIAKRAGFSIEYINGYSWNELVELYEEDNIDLLHSIMKTEERKDMGIFTESYIPLPQVFVGKKEAQRLTSLEEINNEVVAIPKGWGTDQYLEANHPEIQRKHFVTTLDSLMAVSEGKATITMESKPVIEYLLKSYYLDDLAILGEVKEFQKTGINGLHFLTRKELTPLHSIMQKGLASITRRDRRRLYNKWFQNTTNDKAPSGVMIVNGTIPHPELLEMAKLKSSIRQIHSLSMGTKNYYTYVSAPVSSYGPKEYIGLFIDKHEAMVPYLEQIKFSIKVTLILLILLIPLIWYIANLIVKPIKKLSIESNKVKNRSYDQIQFVPSQISEIIDLSTSMTDMAKSIENYEESQKTMMDSLIQLIATAIDKKSPYTGGHCSRVPEIAKLLAEEAHHSEEKPFEEFKLESQEEWREFHIASWLHDCGKVSTPEFIVDKAVKLETIYNRIHEIRTRCEVLLRDAEIKYLKKVIEAPEKKDLWAKEKNEKQQKITEDFAFIAHCNIGGEFMQQEDIDRIKEIAKTPWTRHLDKRLGLSALELDRYPIASEKLPHTESLLADYQEHIIPRTAKDILFDPDHEFAMNIPENLNNQGEVYNLCIQRGTLNAEERYKINEHITTTIYMLETIPYPSNLKKIPEYAGAHHERIAGNGYPRKLEGEQISMAARIIAIADIFEALTAGDRPYKKAKKLSEALKIMMFMVKDVHLDKDLFHLFLSSGIYKEYAKRFLHPDQIDEINIEHYLTT